MVMFTHKVQREISRRTGVDSAQYGNASTRMKCIHESADKFQISDMEIRQWYSCYLMKTKLKKG